MCAYNKHNYKRHLKWLQHCCRHAADSAARLHCSRILRSDVGVVDGAADVPGVPVHVAGIYF